MAYEYDIFVSYRRTDTVGRWVTNHLVRRLEARLEDESPYPVKIFCDREMAEGVNWPEALKGAIRCSRLLCAVWSADYFRSHWCMAEWRSFREREERLGMFSSLQPQGLVYPVRYADGDYFHDDAKKTQCRKDFRTLNYPDDVFQNSLKYLEFDELVKEMAIELIAQLKAVPEWRADFPIVTPVPLPPAIVTRPVI